MERKGGIIEMWRPVGGTLPESGWYLVYLDGKNYNVRYAISYLNSRGHWTEGGECISEDVTHWAPLPEPPTEPKCHRGHTVNITVTGVINQEGLDAIILAAVKRGVRGY